MSIQSIFSFIELLQYYTDLELILPRAGAARYR